jgi:1-acyl-sn-glycerol-3-phosphate acyltransferase
MSAPEIIDFGQPQSDPDGGWGPPSIGQVLRWPLPALPWWTRVLTRILMLNARRRVASIHGVANLRTLRDGFVVAVNHSSRTEAFVVPTMLVIHREGRLIHFLADWNFRLIPGVGHFYKRGGVITVVQKPARPAWLDVFRPFFVPRIPPMEQARQKLLEGRPVGIFPEGTVNRKPDRLLRGRNGAARLSLETGSPVLPVGTRFPDMPPGEPISDDVKMEIHIGTPMLPPPIAAPTATVAEVEAWHSAVMAEIGRLSGKSWDPRRRGISDADG